MRLATHFVSQYRRAALMLLVLFLASAAYAQITPSQDAYTNTVYPTTNYGTATTLGVVNTTASIQTAYIQFDLSSIPAGYTSSNITKATLKLYVNTVPAAGSFNIDFVNGTWGEKKVTSSLAPALGNTIMASVPLTSANAKNYLLLDLTPAVGAWLDGTQANDGIALVANSPLSATFDSKENSTQSHPPELDIVFAGGGGSTITGITTASGSGLTGGGSSGTLNLSLLKSCSSGQVLKWNGSAWACAADASSGGTVTSVGLSAPSGDFSVSGSPVTGSGTLGLNWGSNPPTAANNANAIVRRDGSGGFSLTSLNASGTLQVATGNYNGVYASTTYSAGVAVYAVASSTSGSTNGVFGFSQSPSGVGVSGQGSAGGIGVLGWSDSGTAGVFQAYSGKVLSGISGPAASEVFSVANNGTVKAAGPVIGPSGTAVPLAFASVNAFGTVQSGTSNVTATYNNTTQKYEITISGVSFSRVNYTAIATVSGSVGLRGTTVDDDSSGHLVVGIWNASGNTQQDDFTVVVFQHH